MQVAYIIGKYRDKNQRRMMENIYDAEDVALKYWKKGYAVICPHKNTALFDGYLPDQVWLDGDKELIKRSDVIVVMRNWNKSAGSQDELGLALTLNKKIIYE